MSLPVFHSAAGYSVYRLMGRAGKIRFGRKFLCLGLFLGILPDFDFLPGIFLGDPSLFHRDFSHSPAMAVIVAAAVGAIYWACQGIASHTRNWGDRDLGRRTVGIVLFSFLSYGSHLVLDFFSAGIPLLWPLSDARFSFPLAFFQVARGQGAIMRGTDFYEFLARLGSPAYTVPLLFEFLVVAYAAAFLAAMREMRFQPSLGRQAVFVRAFQILVLTTLSLFVI